MADYGVNINLRVKGQSGLDRLKAKVNELTASIDKIRGVDIMNPRNTGGATGKDARKTIKQYRLDMQDLVKSVNKAQGAFGKTANQQIAAADALQEYSNNLILGTKAQKAAATAAAKQIKNIDLETSAIMENTKMKQKNIDLSKRMGGGLKNQFRGGMNPKGNQAALTSGLISGAFPLLFGQGLLGGAAGFAGGFAGTKIGGQMGGFAGGLVATGALQQLTAAKEKIEELGKALSFFSFDVSAVNNALGLVGTPAAKYLELIEKTEGKQAAFNESMRRMEELVGEDGVKALQDFAESTRELQSSITKFITQVAAKAAELFTGGSERVTGLRRRQLLGEARNSTDTNIQALLTERAGLKGASGRTRKQEIDEEIIALMLSKEKNKENLNLEKLRGKQYDEITKSVENKNLFLNESLTLGTREAEIQEKLREFDRKALQFADKIDQKKRDEFEAALRLQPELEKLNNLYSSISSTIETGLVDAIQSAIDGTKTLGDVARSVFAQIQTSLIQFAVNSALGGLPGIGKFFKAEGGPVKGGNSYIVGEKGPEMFTPGVSGTITPNHALGGSTNVVVNVDASGSNVEGDQQSANEFGEQIAAAVQAVIINEKRVGGLLG